MQSGEEDEGEGRAEARAGGACLARGVGGRTRVARGGQPGEKEAESVREEDVEEEKGAEEREVRAEEVVLVVGHVLCEDDQSRMSSQLTLRAGKRA